MRWTEWENGYLKENYRDGEKKHLMLKLYRHSWKAIKIEAGKLGLTKEEWTEKEKQFLINNYYNGDKEYLMLNLSRHSWTGIKAKAFRLGLKRRYYWTEWKKNFLIKNYYDGDKEYLMLNLNKHSWEAIRKEAQKFGLKRNIQKPRLPVDENFFKTWTKKMAWTFGYWIADGYMGKDNHTVSISSNDHDMLDRVKSIMKSEHKIGENSKNCYSLSIGSKTMYNDILKLGGTPAKSLTIKFPEVPDEFLPDFIRGFMDGDGGVYFYNEYPSIEFCGNYDFLKVLKEKITEHVGINTNEFYIAHKDDPNHSQKIYYLKYYNKRAIALGNYIYQNSENLRLERKHDVYKKFKKSGQTKLDEFK